MPWITPLYCMAFRKACASDHKADTALAPSLPELSLTGSAL